MLKLFQTFLANMKSRLQRIARATKNEVSVEDLHGDAWLAADEIGKKRGREIDFSDPQDQRLILGALNIRNVKRPEKNVRYAARTDATSADDDGNQAGWTDRLHADEEADPLVALLLREGYVDPELMLANSYSQASAYIRTIRNFQGSQERICAHLAISESGFRRRVSLAAGTVRVQPSMFDRIERIPAAFVPLKGTAYATIIKDEREAGQWSWSF